VHLVRHALSEAAHRPDLTSPAPGALIIGVGNAYRRDDAAGLVAARRLRDAARGAATVLDATGEGAALLDAWTGTGTVVLIDAVSSGAPAGSVLRIDARAEPIAQELFRYSSHAFAVPEAIALARVLGRLPARLIVFGIEGACFDAGEGLSPEVERGVDEAVRRTLEEIGGARGGSPDAGRETPA
jgi:hydrogenase maturation protease